MITISKLHNDIPKPIKNMKVDVRPVKGAHLIPECNSAIFLVAKRKSGKTTALFKLIKSCMSKNTIVIIFCANLYRDKSYAAIRKWLKDHDIEWIGYTNIIEEGVNKLDELNEMLKGRAEEMALQEEEEEERIIEKPKIRSSFGDDSDEEDDRKPRKSKYQTPEYIIIFDYMSDQLKKTSLETLLKNARHFARVIISTQYIHDISVGTRSQIGYWLIFKANNSKLPVIHKNADLSIKPEYVELLIYNKAVEEPYSFLYIDAAIEEYRLNLKKANLPPEAFE